MPDALKRSLALFLVFAFAFLSVYFFRAWQGGYSIFGFGEPEDQGQFSPEPATLAPLPALEEEEVPVLAQQNREMTKLVETVIPSVVSIDSQAKTSKKGAASQLTPGLGSGVIVSEEGHIITNYHVIDGFHQIRATLHGGRSLDAILIGKDKLLDIAVLRLKPDGDEKFTPLKFADSEKIKVGQLAIAIGNPFGFRESVTVGYISARDRSYSDKGSDMFQTDAAINPGNSGGPLLNHLGEIMGINTAIFSRDWNNPGFQGIGFAIPSNEVKRSFNYICQTGRPIYGYLGLHVANLNDYLRSVLSYKGDGVVITDVVPGSPADRADLRTHDIVISYNGEGVSTPGEFLIPLRKSEVGAEKPISVWRGDKVINLTAVIEEANPFLSTGAEAEAVQRRIASDSKILKSIGLEVITPPAQYANQIPFGVIVRKVLKDSQGHRLGVQPNDIILHINGQRIANHQDFYFRLVASAAIQSTHLLIQRGNRQKPILLPKVPRTD